MEIMRFSFMIDIYVTQFLYKWQFEPLVILGMIAAWLMNAYAQRQSERGQYMVQGFY